MQRWTASVQARKDLERMKTWDIKGFGVIDGLRIGQVWIIDRFLPLLITAEEAIQAFLDSQIDKGHLALGLYAINTVFPDDISNPGLLVTIASDGDSNDFKVECATRQSLDHRERVEALGDGV